MKISKQTLFISFLVILPFSILIFWFRDGFVLSGAEESFSIFHKLNAFYKNSIWQDLSLGFPQPIYITRIPITLINQFFLFINFPIFLVQFMFFYALMVIGIVSVYFLVKKIFSNFRNVEIIAFISSFFYLFNLYSLSQIWNRFLYSQMGAWAFLPFLVLLIFKYWETNKFFYLIIIFLGQIIFSFVYSIPTNFFLIAFVLLFIFLVEIITTKKLDNQKISKILLIIFTLTFSNIWWVYYNFLYLENVFDHKINPVINFESLRSVSSYFPVQDILLLRQNFLLNKNQIWGFFYKSLFSYFLSILILILALVGLVNYWREKNVRYIFYFFVIILFFAKGINPPLGFEVYKFLFLSFPVTGMFRNPYEKLGILLLLPYAIFVSLGVAHLKILGKYRFLLVTILIVGVSYPMVSGDVMKNFRVKIPHEYENLNNKIIFFTDCKKKGDRILVLPIIKGEGAYYSWGYRGVLPTEFFIDCPLISRYVGYIYSDLEYEKIYEQLTSLIYDEKQFRKMNIRYVLFQKDFVKGGHLEEFWLDEFMVSRLKSKIPLKPIFQDSLFDFYEVEFDSTPDSIININTEGNFFVEKISPVSYLIKLDSSTRDLGITFKSAYHPYWKLKIDKQEYKSREYQGLNFWFLEKVDKRLIKIEFVR